MPPFDTPTLLAFLFASAVLVAAPGATSASAFTVLKLAARARTRLLRAPRLAAWRERLMGTILIGLGVRLALLNRR